ncbi:hypothetical protein BH09PSE2_BH09PSE2_25480 [soil metagenome]
MSSFLAAHAMTLGAAFTCLLAFAKGGPSEKAGAALIGGAWIVSIAAGVLSVTSPYFMLGLDGAAALGFLILALLFSSAWLGVAMLLQAGELFLHSTYLACDGSHMRAYVERVNLLSAAMLWLFLGAVLLAWGRRVWARRRAADQAGAAEAGAPVA